MAKVKSFFLMVFNWIKAFWWILILVFIIVFFGWIYLVKKRNKVNNNIDIDSGKNIVQKIAERVQIAAADARVEHAIIKTKAQEERKELEEIKSISNGVERRKRLADKLKKAI